MMVINRAGPRDYPHFVLQAWGGRLATPPEYRGTPVAKQFESGRIGGRKLVIDERIQDTPDGRDELQTLMRKHRDCDVYYVRSHRHARERLGTRITLMPDFVEKGVPGR
jgi:hypothetical protein